MLPAPGKIHPVSQRRRLLHELQILVAHLRLLISLRQFLNLLVPCCCPITTPRNLGGTMRICEASMLHVFLGPFMNDHCRGFISLLTRLSGPAPTRCETMCMFKHLNMAFRRIFFRLSQQNCIGACILGSISPHCTL